MTENRLRSDLRLGLSDQEWLTCTRECPGLDVSTIDGSGCECQEQMYDTNVSGIVVCMDRGGWTDPTTKDEYKAAQQSRREHGRCAECPKKCAQCAGGGLTLTQGWRLNASADAELDRLLDGGQGGRLQLAFQCPSTTACPALRLAPSALPAAACVGNHSGALCAACQHGFSLRASTAQCLLCHDERATFLGVSLVWFALLLVAVAGLLLYGLWRLKSYHILVLVLKSEVETMAKIVLGMLQVLVLLRDVLDLVFPPAQQSAMSFAALFTLDVQRLMPSFDCMGWSWYVRWSLLSMGGPLACFSLVGLHFLWKRYRHHANRASAKNRAVSLSFLVFLVLYPQVSERIFQALRCRKLGLSLSVLEADYTVNCSAALYLRFRVLAWVLVLLWPFGIPGSPPLLFPLPLTPLLPLLLLLRATTSSIRIPMQLDSTADVVGNSVLRARSVTNDRVLVQEFCCGSCGENGATAKLCGANRALLPTLAVAAAQTAQIRESTLQQAL
jgi:hypothetical protein